MVWFVLAAIGAIFTSLYYFSIKVFLKKTDKYIVGGCTFFIAGLFLLLINLIIGFPTIKSAFWWAAIIAWIINTAALYSASTVPRYTH